MLTSKFIKNLAKITVPVHHILVPFMFGSLPVNIQFLFQNLSCIPNVYGNQTLLTLTLRKEAKNNQS